MECSETCNGWSKRKHEGTNKTDRRFASGLHLGLLSLFNLHRHDPELLRSRDRIELDSLLTADASSGGLVRIENDLVANTTAIASEDRMENRMPFVRFDEGKAHGPYTTWTDWRTYWWRTIDFRHVHPLAIPRTISSRFKYK